MTTAAVILAGGRGTRSADPTVPKIAQKIGGQPLLQWHLDLLAASSIEDVFIVTGHLGDEVEELLHSTNAHSLNTHIIREAGPKGTMPALRMAAQASDSTRFLVILGDIWMSLPLDDFLDQWHRSGHGVAAIVHPSLHPGDSDAVVPQPDGTVTVLNKTDRAHTEGASKIRNMSAAGIFAVTRTALNSFVEPHDIGSELLPQAAANNQLLAYVTSHYLKDTGTPDRLESARVDWESGAFTRRGDLAPRRGLVLDRDGVINPALPEVYEAKDLTLVPGVAAGIADANAAGIPVFVATNQPGLAKGFMTERDHEEIRARLDQLLIAEGAFIDDYVYCPHHPDAGFPGEVAALKTVCSCRKPEPGLLTDLIQRHALAPASSVMVGDSERDLGAAFAAGMPFIRVSDSHPPAAAITEALGMILC